MSKNWTKENNIKTSAKWLSRKIELIEEKHDLIDNQNNVMKIVGKYVPIKKIYRGGVYWAELGQDNIGGEKNKTRPVLVLSPNNMNKGHTVVVVPISKKFHKLSNGMPKYRNHYLLKKSDYESLEADSVVKFEDVRSIDVVRLRELIVNVTKDDMIKMKNNLLYMNGF